MKYLDDVIMTNMLQEKISLMYVVLVPNVNNKSATICSMSNYRHITLASIVYKAFENVIYQFRHPQLFVINC